MRYINYAKYIFLDLILYVLGIFIVPFLYKNREKINKRGKGFFWWFLNDTTEGRDAGLYGRFKHNFFGYYRQCAFRNSHWNFRIYVAVPEKGKLENIKPEGGRTTLYRMPYEGEEPEFGKSFITFSINGKKYFRYSFLSLKNKLWIVKTKYFFTVKRLPTLVNVQLGATTDRYLFKRRAQKYLK